MPFLDYVRPTALSFDSSTTHTQKVRNATAFAMLNHTQSKLQELPIENNSVLEISLDETEMKLKQRGTKLRRPFMRGRRRKRVTKALRGTTSVMMTHATLLHGDCKFELIMLPTRLSKTTSKRLKRGMKARLPISFEDSAKKTRKGTVIIMSDSAKACNKLGRDIASLTEIVRANLHVLLPHCIQHQLVICVAAAYCPLHVINPLFCAANLLHHTELVTDLKIEAKEFLERHLVQSLEEPTPEDLKYSPGNAKL